MKQIKVSVIVPTYNRARYLTGALNSILDQKLNDYEIIIIDDGSQDDTPQIVQTYIQKIGPDTAFYLRQENKGPSSARNLGIEKARGEYITFLDSDDEWHENTINDRIAYMDAHPDISLIFSDASIYRNGELKSQSFLESNKYGKLILKNTGSLNAVVEMLVDSNFIMLPTVIVRSSCFKAIGVFDESLKSVEDVDLWLRILAKYEIRYYDAVVLKRRFHEGNICTNEHLSDKSWVKVLNRLKSYHPSYYETHKAYIKNRLFQTYFRMGYFHFDQYEFPEARRELLNSLKHRWTISALFYFLAALVGSKPVKAAKRLKALVEKLIKPINLIGVAEDGK